MSNNVKKRKFYIVISQILAMSEDDALKYIIESKISYPSFQTYIREYIIYNLDNFPIKKIRKCEAFLEKIRDLYIDILKGNTKQERSQKRIEIKKKRYNENVKKLNYSLYMDYRFLLEEYVNGEEYIYNILNKYRKSYSFFMNLLDSAFNSEELYDRELCKQIIRLLESKEKNVNQEIEYIAPLLLGYIKEGIKIDNILSPFTIFDYYSNFSVPIEYFYLYNGDNIKDNDLNAIKLFIKNSYPTIKMKNGFVEKQVNPFNKKFELKTEYTFNVNGKYVKPILEEREQVMNYLVENKFPIDLIIYKQALRRYANGLLNINHQLKRTF